MGGTNVLVLVGGLLFGGGGIAAILTARTQSRSSSRRDTTDERRLDLEQSESTNKILSAALDWFKTENADLRARLIECERNHDDR